MLEPGEIDMLADGRSPPRLIFRSVLSPAFALAATDD